MPALRGSREASLSRGMPLRRDSTASTASLHSYGTRLADPGLPYPPPRAMNRLPATSRMDDGAILSFEHDHMVKMFQAEATREMSHTPVDVQNNNAQMQHLPVQQNGQITYFTGPQHLSYGSPAMDFSFNTGRSHSLPLSHSQPSMVVMQHDQRRARQSTGPNENELKDMLERNLSRSFDDLAADVRANEKTSSAEKSKQLFAMLWLQRNLVKAKGSVPRTRVHTQYASRCAKFHLQPLNPASFGKLVRVIIPDIQTRRLGVRGESKYHYVDLSLAEDMTASGSAVSRQSQGCAGAASPPDPSAAMAGNAEDESPSHPGSAMLPSEEHSAIGSPTVTTAPSCIESEGRIFPNPLEPVFAPPRLTGTKCYYHRLKFPSCRIMQPATLQEDILLPSIFDYIPPKTDVDAANALSILYLSHVTSLVDCIRFCKEKMFFRLFMQFQGTMTVPVQKLLVHPDLAAWVKECDYIMYQQMIKTVAHLTLQVMPPKVIKFFDTISQLLDQHISKIFAALPSHVLDAKLEPATVFSQLLNRMLRVNQTAHNASIVLMDQNNRDRMWTETVRHVQPKCMINAFLPDCGYDEQVYHLLTHDIRSLLLPLSTEPSLEIGTHYELAAYTQNVQAQPAGFELERICRFIEQIRGRFPTVSSKDLVGYIQGVTSYILRDIVMQTGESYNPWLITKCFVDELSLWLAHVGGFLEREPAKHQHGVEVSMPVNESNDGANTQSTADRAAEDAPRHDGAPPNLHQSSEKQFRNPTGHRTGNQTGNQMDSQQAATNPVSVACKTSMLGLSQVSTCSNGVSLKLVPNLSPGQLSGPAEMRMQSPPVEMHDSNTCNSHLLKQDLELDDSGIGLDLMHESANLNPCTTTTTGSGSSSYMEHSLQRVFGEM